MKNNKIVNIILVILFQSNLFWAQSSTEIDVTYAITSEKLVSDNANDVFESKIFHSFGMGGKRIIKSKFFIKGGVMFKNFGTRFDVEETTVDNPEGTGESYEVNWNAKALDVPISLGYYFLNNKKLRLGIAIGVSNSFVLNQYQETKSDKIEIEVYKKHLLSLNSSLEIGIKVANNTIVNIIPSWQRQVNSNFREYQQRGFGCQLGVSYAL